MMQRAKMDRLTSYDLSDDKNRDGSFLSTESVKDFVNQLVKNDMSDVAAVAAGDQPDAFATCRFGYGTGREAYRGDVGKPYMRDTDSVGVYIIHDVQSPRGYRVITARPRNDDD